MHCEVEGAQKSFTTKLLKLILSSAAFQLKYKYDGILITVPHDCIIKDFNKSIKKITHQSTKILDVKYAFTKKKGITPL